MVRDKLRLGRAAPTHLAALYRPMAPERHQDTAAHCHLPWSSAQAHLYVVPVLCVGIEITN